MSISALMKRASIATATAAIVLGTVAIGQAQAATATFDDLSGIDFVPNGYGGLNWDNFAYFNPNDYFNNSGYQNGTVSGQNVAFNNFALPGIVSVNPGATFDFNSVYLTAAWNNGLNIDVVGLLDGVVKYSQTVTVDTTSPTQFVFNFLGIDTLTFSSYGGTNAGLDADGEHLAMDNFTYTEPVPEPLTIMGTLTAGAFGVALRRRQKQQQKAAAKA